MAGPNAIRHNRLFTMVGFALATAVGTYFSLKSTGALPASASCTLNQSTQSSDVGNWLYAQLMTLTSSRDLFRDVRVVTIASPPVSLSVVNNTCEGRRFLTSLISALDRENARVIAIDKFYSDGSCTEERVNGPFRAALHQSTATIVVGQGTHQRSGTTNQEDCLVLTQAFDFDADPSGPAKGRKVLSGLIRLNRDTMKIPLDWYAFTSDEQASTLNLKDLADQSFPSFSLVAAKQMDDNLTHHPALQKLISKNKHPFGKFSDDIPVWNALDVLCTELGPDLVNKKGWGKCTPTPQTPPDFQHKLVLVGELSNSDRPFFEGKEQYGVYLQANYIGSLLTNSYVEALEVWLDLALFGALAFSLFAMEAIGAVKGWSGTSITLLELSILVAVAAAGCVSFLHYRLFAPTLFLGFLNFCLVFVASAAKNTLVDCMQPSKKVAD